MRVAPAGNGETVTLAVNTRRWRSPGSVVGGRWRWRRSHPARGVRGCASGGAAALGSPFGGAGERSETERAFAVANLGKVRRLQPGTLSVTAFSRASSPIGRAKGRALPAQRNEISARQFGGIRHVGADIIRPPTLQIFEQNHYTPTGATILPMYRVSTKYHRISFANVRHCIVGALRRRCFPHGKTTGRLIAAPTQTVPPHYRRKNFDAL